MLKEYVSIPCLTALLIEVLSMLLFIRHLKCLNMMILLVKIRKCHCKWPQIPDYPYKKLTVDGSGSRKPNALLPSFPWIGTLSNKHPSSHFKFSNKCPPPLNKYPPPHPTLWILVYKFFNCVAFIYKLCINSKKEYCH